MKRLILLLVVLYSINCNFEDCVNEKNIANCSSHDIKELGNFNCHAFRSNFSDDLLKDCEIYPDSAEDQKVFWKIYQGAAKESTPILIHFLYYQIEKSLPQKKNIMSLMKSLM